MTITINLALLPIILTVILLCIMFRPLDRYGYFPGSEVIFRLVWLIPILAIWVIFFAIAYFTK